MIQHCKQHPRNRLLLLALFVWACAISHGFAAGKASPDKDFCQAWPEDRLFIDSDLDSRSFLLEGGGTFDSTPLFGLSGREIVHRTHTLSLDVIDRLSLFKGKDPKSCIIGRDREPRKAFKLPVFFVGRVGQNREDLTEDAKRVVFAPSAQLSANESFTDVRFRLRRGGSLFTQIRPFFRCGLPGIFVCEGSCPDDSLDIASDLVSWAVHERTPAAQPKPEANKSVTPTIPSVPATPKVEPFPAPAHPLPQPLPDTPKQEAATPSPPAAPPSSPPASPAPQSAAPPANTRGRLVLVLKKANGVALPAGDVLQAEGSVSIGGVQLQASWEGLAADLPEEALQRARELANLKQAFKQHRVLAAKPEGERVLLTVEPLYVRADQLSIKIQDANGEPIKDCAIGLDVASNRRLGGGWAKIGARSRALSFSFSSGDMAYKLDLPSNIAENELLIGTEPPGAAARIFNTAPRCGLEAKPIVSAEELRTSNITRLLRETGPILIALLTTDSAFASSAGDVADSYWGSALDLISAVSKEAWEKIFLVRAQAPGVAAATEIIGQANGGAELDDTPGERRRRAALLSEGSRTKPGPLAILRSKPIERFHLDVVLKTLREKAEISAVQSAQQEALLLVSGSIKMTGSDFCRRAVRGEIGSTQKPQWLKQARRALILEVWSETAIEALKKEQRVEPVEGEGAPAGLFRCKIGGEDGDKIKLYGLGLPALLDNGARMAAFTYLTAQARTFLKP